MKFPPPGFKHPGDHPLAEAFFLLRSAILSGLLLILVATAAQAGTPAPPTPVGLACVLEDTDACAVGTWTPAAAFVQGVTGSFEGSTVVEVTDGVESVKQTCWGTYVGVLVVGGGCVTEGNFPRAGLPLTLKCSSVGVGTLTCQVTGA